MKSLLTKRLGEHQRVICALMEDTGTLELIAEAGEQIVRAVNGGGAILLCGNGGSAADAQHLAAELVGRFKKERPGVSAEALSVNTSSLTAIGNDYGYQWVFARQVEARGRAGDVLIGISTSGKSANVLLAIERAKRMGIFTIGLTGASEQSSVASAVDICVCVPSTDTARIQEAHILIGHTLCEYVENNLPTSD